MQRGGRSFRLSEWLVLVACLAGIGCESAPRDQAMISGIGSAHRVREIESAQPAADTDLSADMPAEMPIDPVIPATTEPAISAEEIQEQIPDPADETERIAQELAKPELKEPQRSLERERLERLLERLNAIRRPDVLYLSLNDAIRRALLNSYLLQSQGYEPAVAATHIVEAEAQFDAVYYAKYNWSKQDTPTASQLMSSASDARNFTSGVRKLLSAGTQVQLGYEINRNWTNLVFATLNPSYSNKFFVEFRQPFLRGFGLDFNRSQIERYKIDRRISIERLRREIRETVFEVTQSYWALFQARRGVTIVTRLIFDLEYWLQIFEARREWDVLQSDVSLMTSRIEHNKAELVKIRSELKKYEDALKVLLNDPDLNFASDVEIIPTDALTAEPLVLDRLGEVSAALMHRAELREAKLTIEQAELAVGVAKNQALPKLDVMFRYIVDGLGANWHNALGQLGENDFHEYILSLEFEWPIGNRGPEAALRRARLQQAQAIAAHRGKIESTIRDVHNAIYEIQSNFEQIPPSLNATRAADRHLQDEIARVLKYDQATVLRVIDGTTSLASDRQQLLQSLTNYNIGLINLERQKGTLLEYHNIVIQGDDENFQASYQPTMP